MSNVRIYDAAAKVLAREIAACLDRATPLSLGEAGIDALTETISRHFPNRIAGTLPEWGGVHLQDSQRQSHCKSTTKVHLRI
jgi:hypothetical protein